MPDAIRDEDGFWRVTSPGWQDTPGETYRGLPLVCQRTVVRNNRPYTQRITARKNGGFYYEGPAQFGISPNIEAVKRLLD